MDDVSCIGCRVIACHVIEPWVATSYIGCHATSPSHGGHMGVMMRKREREMPARVQGGTRILP